MNQLLNKYILALLFIKTAFCVHAQEENQKIHSRPDAHAPIGVMGDHTHGKGEVMFSYRMMIMNMDGMQEGSISISNEEVLENYMVTPLNMNMKVHMFGMMYAPYDRVTLMAMVNYHVKEMKHLTRMGGQFTTSSSSLGDTKFSVLYKLVNKGNYSGHLNIGLSIPTGNIKNKGVTPASEPNEVILPYPMQNGSGSFEFSPGYTFVTKFTRLSLGGQLMGTFRLNENSRSYRYGNEFNTNLWSGFVINNWLSTSLRLQYEYEGKLNGQDEAFQNLMMVSTVDPENFGGQYLNGALGLNFLVPSGNLKDLRFAAEYVLPFYQDVNGIQMERVRTLVFGVQYAL